MKPLSVTIKGGSRFENNSANFDGGAMRISAVRDVSINWDAESILANNRAGQDGGGIFTSAEIANAYLTNNSNWTGNTAGNMGGALYVRVGSYEAAGSVTVDDASTLAFNSARDGGAIFIDGYATFNMSGMSILASNTAGRDGGAVVLSKSPHLLRLGSCIVTNNLAVRGYGGAFSIITTVSAVQFVPGGCAHGAH